MRGFFGGHIIIGRLFLFHVYHILKELVGSFGGRGSGVGGGGLSVTTPSPLYMRTVVSYEISL